MIAIVAAFMGREMSDPHPYRHRTADLAKVSHAVSQPRALREDAILVGIQKDGTTFSGIVKVRTNSELSANIRERLSRGAERKVYFNVDVRTKYGSVTNAIDAVADAGIHDIAFIVEQRRIPTASLQ